MSKATTNPSSLPTWRLEDLYASADAPELAADIDLAKRLADEFCAKYSGKVVDLFAASAGSPSAAQRVHAAISELEELFDLMGRVSTYAFLHYCEDNANPQRARFYGDISAKVAQSERQLLFFNIEINQVSDEDFANAIAHPPLARYASSLEDIRRARAHQLSKELEQMVHDKSLTGAEAWVRLYDTTLSALRVQVGDDEHTIESALSLMSSANAEERERCAHALARVFGHNVQNISTMFNVLLQDKAIDDRWRNYSEPASSRHLANRVEGEVVEAMVAAVREAYPRLSHRYYRLKAQWAGVDRLNYWDRNAPVLLSDNRKFEFDTARQIVLDAYGDFSGRMREIGERFFAERWIDAAPTPGKMSGAFAHPCAPSVHPYIMLNYQGRTRDVMTLAHELGHGVHQVLASEQGPILASTPLTLAETASVFGEMLTFQSMLKQTTDANAKRAQLAAKVEDMLNTVVRQVAFYTFEKRIHAERVKGEISPERYGEIWLEVQGESLGSGIRLNDGYENYWCYVSHFTHAPFYVYAYAFGDCLVNSLYARYTAGVPDFETKYFDLLAAGGSRPYHELLAPFDINPRDPHFWNEGLDAIGGLIDQLESA